MATGANLHEGLVEGLKFGMLELSIIESEEVVHDNIASQSRECMSEVHRFLPRLKLQHSGCKSVDMALDNVQEAQNGPAREPAYRLVFMLS